ncbi:reverse transcriptase domain-containing protein [Marinobacterium mangrovicola]|uniref:Reverse transcriptase (RNA-dependent DNA polymerase) n=1 Tax=Marinobacterium mangrovicola TaxID=1476959 RepID=A0A4R1GGL3_9GAMM|nr:reverse transcriptase domain-containing protein [Marinobacterium mangrovicola]TCK07454.1 reverse transcriptase (RNA-dependent DNA polymerase) [Marinobacterium mangrovicola]
MPVLDKKYEKLALNDDYLTDPLLFALAWKKAHEYIRTTNWYADHFELDTSSIDLANRCDEWAKEVKDELTFTPLELVPAPKSHPWEFVKQDNDPLQLSEYRLTWQPENLNFQNLDPDDDHSVEDSPLKLRPLAHISIREQTIMTLVMMCLANEVESKQGDPSTSYDEVHKKGIVSYGNRLYCRYKDDEAEHSYGATTTYSKFFTDYRKFLERPYYFAKNEIQDKSDEEEVYLVELDISQFFDCIKRPLLVKKIAQFSQKQEGNLIQKTEVRKNIFTAFKDWEWSVDSNEKFKQICSSEKCPKAPFGLPQGLVASGFLANIYMSDFDDRMKEKIGHIICEHHDIRLVDYCRYVDDMRFVLVGPNRNKIEEKLGKSKSSKTYLEIIKNALLDITIPLLDELNLESNPNKTKVEVFRGKSVGISQTLEDIQNSVSGPISYDDTEVHLDQLESLLALSKSKEQNQSDGHGYYNRLAAIEKDMFDVREDTLKRFAANKISKLLNSMRHFTSRKTDENGKPIPGDWDYLQERLARRLIACWSRDPALVLLLKKGIELFPSTKLLEPILEQLQYLREIPFSPWRHIVSKQSQTQAAIGTYCLAEIYRHAATVIHRKDRQAVPAHADIDQFFELLQSNAIDETAFEERISSIEETASSSPENAKPEGFNFLAAQARFLLLVRMDTTLEGSSGCWFHDLIFKLANGFRKISLDKDATDRDIATAIVISSQIIEDIKPLLRAASSLLDDHKNPPKILELIAIQDATLLRSLVLHARALKYSWLDSEKVQALIEKLYINTRPSAKKLEDITSYISLYKLVARPDNPFGNEIMALKLMRSLLRKSASFDTSKKDEVIDLAKTKVKFDKLSASPSFNVFDAEVSINLEFNKALSEAAGHLHSQQDDTFILQRIALCVRAVLSGLGDPTGFGTSVAPKTGYRGLKTTQFKRQIGLLTTPEALAGEAAQFSGWLTTLLSKLLKWPGIRVNDQGYSWPIELSVESVSKLVDKRLNELKDAYCIQSSMPGLPELVSPSWDKSKKDLVVAMVQAKMPRQQDFAEHGQFLDDPEYRTKHRRHIARVAKLVTKHIEAQHLDKPTNGEREQNIDLIVLPELAVHQDDMDILIHLSRKTHAIIVAGLGFIKQPGSKQPKNCAVWIVPRKHNGNNNEIQRFQGKHHMTAPEVKLGIQPWRPYQLILELAHPAFPNEKGFCLSAAICFDSTDIALSADLRDKSNALLIPALNRDVNTFDSMVEALHYHMYQHVVLVNTGEYGGSYAMAPYDKRHERLISHSSGNDQVTINTFRMNMFDFRRDGVGASMQSGIKQKSAPAGV